VRGVAWPALPDGATAMTLALAWQLERSQWWSPDELRAHQRRQLALLAQHAAATTDHYAGLPADAAETWPILSREALIAAGPRLLSKRYPAEHGRIGEVLTSR